MFWHEAILPLWTDLQVQESLNIPPPKFCHTRHYLILHMTSPLWPATFVHIVWLLLLHDAIKMESNYTWINYNYDNIATRSHIMIYNFVWNFILVPNLVAFISQKEKSVWFFVSRLLTCSVRKMALICLMQNIDVCFPNECLLCNRKMLLHLVTKMKYYTSFYIIKWLLMAGYIIVDSCVNWHNFYRIVLLKKFYNIATKVSGRKVLRLVIYLTDQSIYFCCVLVTVWTIFH